MQYLVVIPQTLASEFWVAIRALRWIVRPVFNDKSNFTPINLAVVYGVRELQEYSFSDDEVSSLLLRKVLFDKLAIGTSKVVEGVGEVLTDVDFAVRIGDLVNNLQKLLFLISPNFSLLHKLLEIIDSDTKHIPKTVCVQRSFTDISAYGFFF